MYLNFKVYKNNRKAWTCTKSQPNIANITTQRNIRERFIGLENVQNGINGRKNQNIRRKRASFPFQHLSNSPAWNTTNYKDAGRNKTSVKYP